MDLSQTLRGFTVGFCCDANPCCLLHSTHLVVVVMEKYMTHVINVNLEMLLPIILLFSFRVWLLNIICPELTRTNRASPKGQQPHNSLDKEHAVLETLHIPSYCIRRRVNAEWCSKKYVNPQVNRSCQRPIFHISCLPCFGELTPPGLQWKSRSLTSVWVCRGQPPSHPGSHSPIFLLFVTAFGLLTGGGVICYLSAGGLFLQFEVLLISWPTRPDPLQKKSLSSRYDIDMNITLSL